MEAFRHYFLLLFLRSYFNDKCPERIIACKSTSNARAQISPLAGGFPFTLTENGRALYRSDITCVRSKMIFSPEFNVAISVGVHRQKHKLAHMPTNVNQYFRIRIRMSFIARYVYTYEEFVFMTEATAAQQNDSDRTKNTDNKNN